MKKIMHYFVFIIMFCFHNFAFGQCYMIESYSPLFKGSYNFFTGFHANVCCNNNSVQKNIKDKINMDDDFIIRLSMGDSIRLSKIFRNSKGEKIKDELITITCDDKINSKCTLHEVFRSERVFTEKDIINLIIYYDTVPRSIDYFSHQSNRVNWIGVHVLNGQIAIESNSEMEDLCEEEKAENMTNIDYKDRKVKICRRSPFP